MSLKPLCTVVLEEIDKGLRGIGRMAYCEDRPIHLKIRSLRKVVHTFCGKPVNNLSKNLRKVLILLVFPWFAISCSNSKTPVVSATIEETEYYDMVDCQKTPYSQYPSFPTT
jgi:hypothetical protein